jgi:hypothetical protein
MGPGRTGKLRALSSHNSESQVRHPTSVARDTEPIPNFGPKTILLLPPSKTYPIFSDNDGDDKGAIDRHSWNAGGRGQLPLPKGALMGTEHHENRQFNPAPHLAWKGPHLAWNCTPSQLSCNDPQFRQYPGLATVLNDRYPAWQKGFLTHVTAPSTNFSVIPRKEGCEISPPL